VDELEITDKGQILRSNSDRMLQKNVLEKIRVASARPDKMRLWRYC